MQEHTARRVVCIGSALLIGGRKEQRNQHIHATVPSMETPAGKTPAKKKAIEGKPGRGGGRRRGGRKPQAAGRKGAAIDGELVRSALTALASVTYVFQQKSFGLQKA